MPLQKSSIHLKKKIHSDHFSSILNSDRSNACPRLRISLLFFQWGQPFQESIFLRNSSCESIFQRNCWLHKLLSGERNNSLLGFQNFSPFGIPSYQNCSMVKQEEEWPQSDSDLASFLSSCPPPLILKCLWRLTPDRLPKTSLTNCFTYEKDGAQLLFLTWALQASRTVRTDTRA